MTCFVQRVGACGGCGAGPVRGRALRPSSGMSLCACRVGARRSRFGQLEVMVMNVSVVITDELDGSPGTVSFGVDGMSYESDLGSWAGTGSPGVNAPRSSRSAAGEPGQPPQPGSGTRAAGRGPIVLRCGPERGQRAWQCRKRGRISAEVVNQYDAAH
jgi:hypothetical protein